MNVEILLKQTADTIKPPKLEIPKFTRFTYHCYPYRSFASKCREIQLP